MNNLERLLAVAKAEFLKDQSTPVFPRLLDNPEFRDVFFDVLKDDARDMQAQRTDGNVLGTSLNFCPDAIDQDLWLVFGFTNRAKGRLLQQVIELTSRAVEDIAVGEL